MREKLASSGSVSAKPRAKLTQADAIKIFTLKQYSQRATSVASLFSVSEKAVRDIWTARTWAKETWHLEPSRVLVIKHTGRPKGKRDSKPRKNARLDLCCSPLTVEPNCSKSEVDVRSLSSIQNDTSDDEPSHCRSLDEQLGEWSPELWNNQGNADPFDQDWKCTKRAF